MRRHSSFRAVIVMLVFAVSLGAGESVGKARSLSEPPVISLTSAAHGDLTVARGIWSAGESGGIWPPFTLGAHGANDTSERTPGLSYPHLMPAVAARGPAIDRVFTGIPEPRVPLVRFAMPDPASGSLISQMTNGQRVQLQDVSTETPGAGGEYLEGPQLLVPGSATSLGDTRLFDLAMLHPNTIAPPMPQNRVFDGEDTRFELGEAGQLLAQNSPPSGAPSQAPNDTAPSEATREANLAKQLANPISTLISVPFQQNIEFGIGPTNGGWHDLMNIQPVVPFTNLMESWNLIARMIMPVVYQNEIFPGAGSQFGLGDTTFQFFFSPKEPTPSGIIWGVGPTLFAPTGTDPLLSGRTWGAGPDFVVLRQSIQSAGKGVTLTARAAGVWTYGMLASQTWSFAGPGTINTLFLQPFLAFTFPDTVTINLQTQATYAWNQSQWTVPIIASASKIFKFGDQLTSIGFGVKYYAVRPITAPEWGIQFVVTLLFPNK